METKKGKSTFIFENIAAYKTLLSGKAKLENSGTGLAMPELFSSK